MAGVHSLFSPSGISRVINCPGSVKLCRQVGKAPDTIYSAEGTAAHALAEMCLEHDHEKADRYMDKYIEIEVNGKPENYQVTEKMIEGVNIYLDTVNEIRAGIPDGKAVMQIEVKRDCGMYVKDMYGTPDCVIFDTEKKTLYVVDYKNGVQPVAAEWNSQLMCYALGADKAFDAVADIVLVIVQPNTLEGEKVSAWETDRGTLLRWARDILIPSCSAAMMDQAPKNVGAHCRWCDAKPVCPAMVEFAQSIAKTEFGAAALPSPDELTPEDMIRVYEGAKIINDWLPSVVGYMQRQMEAGAEYPGYKLVHTRVNRKIKPDEIQGLQFELGDDAFVKKLKGVGELESLFKKIYGWTAKKAKEHMDAMCYKPEPGITVAPESDKRPPIIATAKADFSGLPEADYLN